MMHRLLLAPLAFLPLFTFSADAAPARKAPAHRMQTNWLGTVAATPEGGMRLGNPNARVKLIEYGSRTCPHCAKFDAEGFPALKTNYVASGRVSYEFRDYPVHGALDLGPILLGQCAGPQHFFPLLDAMMAHQTQLAGQAKPVPAADQQRLQSASPNEIAAYFADFYGYTALSAKFGVTPAKARACLADRAAIEAIAKRTDDANRLYQVASTPTFLINGTAANAAEWAELEPALKAALAK